MYEYNKLNKHIKAVNEKLLTWRIPIQLKPSPDNLSSQLSRLLYNAEEEVSVKDALIPTKGEMPKNVWHFLSITRERYSHYEAFENQTLESHKHRERKFWFEDLVSYWIDFWFDRNPVAKQTQRVIYTFMDGTAYDEKGRYFVYLNADKRSMFIFDRLLDFETFADGFEGLDRTKFLTDNNIKLLTQ